MNILDIEIVRFALYIQYINHDDDYEIRQPLGWGRLF